MAKIKEGRIMKKKIIMFTSIIFVLIIVLLAFELTNKYNSSSSNIPKVYLEGDINNMTTKKDEREVLLKYKSSDVNFEKYIKIKIQGTSSIAFEKKNYTINFYKDNSYEQKEKVDVNFGWGEQSKYCLKANWIDKTHARNIVAARITAKVQEKYGLFTDTPHNGTIDGFPVEMYINGKFLGLYTWNIPKDAWMWNMDEENPNHMVLGGDDWTNSTLLAVGVDNFSDAGWDVEVGTETQEARDNFNRLINFINNSTNDEFIENFDSYLNKDASINYLILMQMMEAIDNGAKNMMMVTYDGNIWYPSLYDLDSTFGTNPSGVTYSSYETDTVNINARLWNKMLICFPNEIADRYFELRQDILTKENILREFNSFIDEIPESTYKKESKRWGEIPGYGIDQIEEFLNVRIPYLDNIMNNIKQ